MTSNQVAVRQDDGEMKMSSREIAELTGKRHDNVMRDIEVMVEGLDGDILKFEGTYKDASNRNQNMYLLDRYHTEILITGYDVKRRAAVIKRWFDPIPLIWKGLAISRLKRGIQKALEGIPSTPSSMSSSHHANPNVCC